MILTNKLLPVALVAALIGGSVGALVMHSRGESAEAKTTPVSQPLDAQYVSANDKDRFIPAEFNTSAEQSAYKSGFADGFRACDAGAAGAVSSSNYRAAQSASRCLQKHR